MRLGALPWLARAPRRGAPRRGAPRRGAPRRGAPPGHGTRGLLGVALLALVALIAGCARPGGTVLAPAPYTPRAGQTLPDFSHVFVIVMENRGYGDIIGNSDAPYVNQLARAYGLATNYYAVAHPSLPNYLALLGGQTFGVTSDCETCFVHGANLVDALAAGGKTWSASMEGLPSPCYVGDAGDYAQKHDPFIYFTDILANPARCHDIVPLTQLGGGLASGNVPDFVWVTPNLCHDMHSCSTQTGDQWLASFVPRILASPAWRQGGVLFITWDEGTSDAGCCGFARGGRVPLLVISPLGKRHFTSAVPYDHYSLLRTIADAWHLREPGHAASPASHPLLDFFTGA